VVVSVEAAAQSIDARQDRGPMLSDRAAVIMPVAYAMAFNISFRTDENPSNGPDGLTAAILFALKLLTVVALIVGLHRVGERAAQRPATATVAAGIWASIGTALVVAVAWAKERGVVLGSDQL
jgi:hypothetical protein